MGELFQIQFALKINLNHNFAVLSFKIFYSILSYLKNYYQFPQIMLTSTSLNQIEQKQLYSLNQENPHIQFKPHFNRRDFQTLYNLTKGTYFTKNGSDDQDDTQPTKTHEMEALRAIVRNPSPQFKLVCAKSCFLQGDYQACRRLLQKIEVQNSKLLYQKTALHIQAAYLENPNNEERIKQIWKQYSKYRQNCMKYNLSRIQSNELKAIKKVALSFEEVNKKCREKKIIDMKHTIDDVKFMKNYEGTPTFLISKFWITHFTKYLSGEKSQPPGPITNFQLLNHIYEYQYFSTTDQPDFYRDRILFPTIEEIDYVVVNEEVWKYLFDIFGGTPITRAYIKNPSYRVMTGADTMRRILVKASRNKEHRLFQIQTGTRWQTTFIPYLSKKYGMGQLKVCINGEYHLQKRAKILGINHTYKFINFKSQLINFDNEEEKETKRYLMENYDFEKYDPQTSNTFGVMGLANTPDKTSYFNSVIQVLSHLFPFSSYLLTNSYLQYLNLSNSNSDGYFGEIVCCLATTIKDLWYRKPEVSYSVNAQPLKNLILDLYIKGKQMNLQDHMCIQEPPPKPINIYRKSKIQRFMQFRIPPPEEKSVERDPALLLRIMFKALGCDLSDRFSAERPQTTMITNKDFLPKDIWKLYQGVKQFYEEYNNSIVFKLFAGIYSSTFECRYCSYKKLKLEPFRVFNLTVPLDNPKEIIYYVPNKTIGEQAIRILFCTEGLETLADLIVTLRKDLQIDDQEELVPYMVDQKFNLIDEEVPETTSIKDLFDKIHLLKYSLFLYAVFPKQENQCQALVLYRYGGFQKKFDLADGFPRFIPVLKTLLQPDNQEVLFNFLLDTIPLTVYEASKRPCIDKILTQIEKPPKKGQKKKFHDVIITVRTKNPIKNFRFIPNKQAIGLREANVILTLDKCFENFIEKTLINIQKSIYCPKCHKDRNVHTSGNLYEIGDVVMVRLDRFVSVQKITTMIRYPLQKFDIHKYIKTKKLVQEVYESIKNKKQKKKMQPVVHEHLQKPQYYYNLVGVINHRGVTIQNGEFYSYCKALNGKWYEFNNQIVKQISEELVNDFNAYILVYLKDPTSPIQRKINNEPSQLQKQLLVSQSQQHINSDLQDMRQIN